MKPMIFVPPAQAEALYDTQADPRDVPLDDQAARQPWRDDEILPELKPSAAGFRQFDRVLAERPA